MKGIVIAILLGLILISNVYSQEIVEESNLTDSLKFKLEGIVKDQLTEEVIQSAVIKIISSDGSYSEIETDSLGHFTYSLTQNLDYSFIVEKKKYLIGRGNETTKGYEKSKMFFHEYSLQRVCGGFPGPPKVYYESNGLEPVFKNSSEDVYLLFYELLKDNLDIVVQFGGGRDATEDDSISLRRVNEFVDKLLLMNADKNRIVVIDNGVRFEETKYGMNDKDLQSAREENRRLTFKVLRDDYVAE